MFRLATCYILNAFLRLNSLAILPPIRVSESLALLTLQALFAFHNQKFLEASSREPKRLERKTTIAIPFDQISILKRPRGILVQSATSLDNRLTLDELHRAIKLKSH